MSSSIHRVTELDIFLTIGFPYLLVLIERIIFPYYTLCFYNFQLQVRTEIHFYKESNFTELKSRKKS